MFTKPPYKMIVCALLLAFLTNTSIGAKPAKRPAKPRSISRAEKSFLRELGLPVDVNDTEIIRLLDVPKKRIYVMGLIERRKISSAVPKLLQIVNDPNTFCIVKIASADTLCFLGNNEWLPTIKALSTDPNDLIAGTSYAIRVAGLLARAGDYSQFEIVAAALGDSKYFIRNSAIAELASFNHKSDPVTDLAIELLVYAATTDSDSWLRWRAIDSLDKIVKKKPQTKPRLIYALKANKHSQDKRLRLICEFKLKVHTPNRKDEKGKQP